MVIGNSGIPMTPIIRELKITLYRLHPIQKEYDAIKQTDGCFGEIMVCPNLPNNLHSADVYRKKGFKETPEELMPRAELKRESGGFYLVPNGYELKCLKTMFKVPDSGYLQNQKLHEIEGDLWKVVKVEEGVHKCECGFTAQSLAGLKAHQRSHEE